jgi:hypothetical protein
VLERSARRNIWRDDIHNGFPRHTNLSRKLNGNGSSTTGASWLQQAMSAKYTCELLLGGSIGGDKVLPITVREAFLEFNAYAEIAGFQFNLPSDDTKSFDWL